MFSIEKDRIFFFLRNLSFFFFFFLIIKEILKCESDLVMPLLKTIQLFTSFRVKASSYDVLQYVTWPSATCQTMLLPITLS